MKILLLTILLCLTNSLVYGIYAPMNEEMPQLRAILCKTGNSVALGSIKGNRFFIQDGDILDKKWRVEQIRRKSTLFRNLSDKKFVEIFINNDRPVRRTRDITFIAYEIELFEALEMVATVFDLKIFMSHESVKANQKLTFAMQPTGIPELLRKLTKPDNNKALQEGKFVYVLPEKHRFNKYENIQNLEKVYPGLEKEGWMIAENEDIQSVLRRFTNGSGVTVMVDKDLHFPVYVVAKKIKFSTILENIICLNNCSIIEYEKGIEVKR